MCCDYAKSTQYLPQDMYLVLMNGQKQSIEKQREKRTHAEKETGEQNADCRKDELETASLFQRSVYGEQSSEEKWKVADKHNMVVAVEDHRRSQKIQYCKQKGGVPAKPFVQPEITENAAEQRQKDAGDLDICCHGNTRKCIGEQENRAVQPIIGEIENVLSAAQMHSKIREPIPGGIETGAKIFRNGKVLIAPVCLRTVNTVRMYQKNQAYDCTQNQRQTAAVHENGFSFTF